MRPMDLHPLSLLVTAAVLLPNVLFVAFPPARRDAYGKPREPLFLAILEKTGQAASFILPLLYPLSFTGALAITAWGVMGLALAFYYAGWVRYLVGKRDYALLFAPMAGIPVPMAVSPVLYFACASAVLGSPWQAAAALVLGVGHITITARTAAHIASRGAPSAPVDPHPRGH
jgi:hypothetical protein